MTDRIEQKPSEQGRWCVVVSKHPKFGAADLQIRDLFGISMNLADGAGHCHGLAIPAPFPIKPRSITTPIATIKRPLKDDSPQNEAVAQQYPRVVVGRNTSPSTGVIGFGTARALEGVRTNAALKNQIKSKTNRGANRPSAANRHISWPEAS